MNDIEEYYEAKKLRYMIGNYSCPFNVSIREEKDEVFVTIDMCSELENECKTAKRRNAILKMIALEVEQMNIQKSVLNRIDRDMNGLKCNIRTDFVLER